MAKRVSRPDRSLARLTLASIIALPLLGSGACAQGWRLATNLTLKADLTLKETYDSNVYLQDTEPSPSVTNAVRPFQESLVTSVTPRLALDWKPMPEFGLTTFYAPEVVTYHNEPHESHVAHRTALTFAGQVGIVTWEQFNTLTVIEGDEEGLTFGGPGGAPAIGGIPIRDRRPAVVYRNGFRAFHPIENGAWFFRPVAWSYVHDFQTKVRPRSEFPFYQNYVDRNDFTVGLDVGYKAFPAGYVIIGYRFGFQDEPALPGENIHYSNDYHRFVLGYEGKVTDWLKITGVVGGDWRDFAHHTPVGFEDHHLKLYYDASLVFTPRKQDTITILLRQFEQPAFGAPSAYEDITWEITARHQFNPKLACAAGFRAYGGDWLAPVQRDDWIYTPSVSLSFTPNPHLSGEVSYGFDRAISHLPGLSGREFTRHLVSIGVKYAF